MHGFSFGHKYFRTNFRSNLLQAYSDRILRMHIFIQFKSNYFKYIFSDSPPHSE
jgi:hypothetical protein